MNDEPISKVAYTLIFRYGFDYELVMDRLSLHECRLLLANSQEYNRDLWETNRLTNTILANLFSKKKRKPQDIVKFPWEKEPERPAEKPDFDVDRIKRNIAEYQARLDAESAAREGETNTVQEMLDK